MNTMESRTADTRKLACGCIYQQLPVPNVGTLAGKWLVLKWVRTWPCAAHLDVTCQDA